MGGLPHEAGATMISKTGLYVIRALAALAELPEDQWIGTASLAEKTKAPVNYLSKLLHTLAREGLVLSQKGVRGGIRLARPAHRISLYQALDPFEDFSRLNECLLGTEHCRADNPCAVNARWEPVRRQYLRFLHETTAADLVADARTFVPPL